MASELLLIANKARREPATASPYDLWKLAFAEAANHTARVVLFRHAMIHSGYLVDNDTGRPYPTCSLCGETLGAG